MKLEPQRPQVATVSSLPAPVGGLNAESAINFMPKTDALVLTNWIAEAYGVRTRKGWYEHAINLAAEVKTIFEYAPDRSASTYKMFASTDANIYDVTNSTNAPAVSLALSNVANAGRFSTSMFANSAGTFLAIAAQAGGYSYYNGAAWATPTFGAGAGQINNVDPVKFIFVLSWKRRLWFVEKGTANGWYLAVDSVTGAATKFDFGPQLRHGGGISFLATWTIDAGEGIDDLLVVGGENGDILIYKGTDPTSTSTFGIVGTWYVGPLPVGRRPACSFGGDLLVLTSNGLQPLSYVTRGGQSLLRASSVDYLKKVQTLFQGLLNERLTQTGWELCLIPKDNLLLILVPPNGTTTYEQYALKTNGSTWSKFTNMSMNTVFASVQGAFFGTTDGKVCRFLSGYFDAIPYGSSVGNGIPGIIQFSYNYFNNPGQTKQAQMVRPVFLAADRPNVTVTVVADFEQNILTSSPVYAAAGGVLWDVAKWDSAVWAGALTNYKDWYAAGAIGFALSVYLNTICVADTFLAAVDVMYEPVQNGPQI